MRTSLTMNLRPSKGLTLLSLLFPLTRSAEIPYNRGPEEVVVEPLDPLLSLQSVIPGVPGSDYPIYGEVPQTEFSCEGRVTVIALD